MSFEKMKDTILNLQKEDYGNFIKALISIEKDIEKKEVLDELYDKYMENDSMGLIDENFDYLIDMMIEEGKI